MSNFNVRVVATANVTQMSAAYSKLEAQVTALNAQLAQMVKLQNGVDAKGYENLARAAARNSTAYRNAAASTGMFEVQQLKVNSATDDYVKSLGRQKLSFREMIKQSKVASAAYREQLAMQNMVVRQSQSSTVHGKQMLDVTYPREISKDLDTAGHRMAWFNSQLKSGATQMVNWGKNTQWAGRQLMVGFTMPIAAAGAAAGVMAYQTDKALTQVAKVYDTTANQNSSNVKEQMAAERELQQVREQGMQTALSAAKQYGAAGTDTINVMAELAATGKRGAELQADTAEVMRISMLGDLDYQDSIKSTIALQSVFRMNTAELTKSFNYMNAVENATSLTTQDFAQAIPIAAAPVKQFGGDVQELGVLLTAMKSRGIEATQGANAIKAAMQRLGRPSAQVKKEFQDITGADISKIFEQSTSLIDLFQRINKVTDKLSNKDKIKVFAGLFGSYQVTRMSALVDGMNDLNDVTTQTGKAFQLSGESADKWAQIAATEVERKMNSLSGRWSAAIEEMKLELATLGKPFVEVATIIVSSVSKVIKAFNGLPHWLKVVAAVGIGFAAIAGPMVMITGLMANLIGNTLKAGAAFTSLFVRMDILPAEGRAAKLAGELAAAGFITETSAVEKLVIELQALTQAQLEANAAVAASPNAPRAGTRGGTAAVPTNPNVVVAGAGAGKLADDSDKVAKNAEKTGKAWKAAGGGMILATGAMAAMAYSSNSTVDDLAQMVMYAGLLAPALAAIPWKSMGTGIAGLAGKGAAGGAGMKGMATGALRLVTTFARFAGPTGLIVAAIGGLAILHSHIDDNAEALAKMNDTAEKWAEIYGYQAKEAGTIVDPKSGEAVSTFQSKVDKLQKSAPEVGKAIKKAFDDAGGSAVQASRQTEAMNIAIRQGLEVIKTGGTADQAREAARVSLMAGLQDATQVEKLMKEIDLQVKFKVNRSVMQESIQQVIRQVNQAVDDEIGKTKSEAVWDFFSGNRDISAGSRQAGENAATDFYDSFSTASAQQQIAMSREVQAGFDRMYSSAVAAIKTNPAALQVLQDAGLYKKGMDDKTLALNVGTADYTAPGTSQALKDMGIDFDAINKKVSSIATRNKEFTQDVAQNAGFTKDVYGNFLNMDQLLAKLIPGYMSVTQAQKAYQAAVIATAGDAATTGKSFTAEQRLQILNQFRMQAGLQKTANVLDGFGPVTKKWTGELKNAEHGANSVANAVRSVSTAAQSAASALAGLDASHLASTFKDAMSGVQQGIADDYTKAFDTDMNNAIKSRQSYWDRRSKSLDADLEQKSNALDAKWEKRRNGASAYWDAREKSVDRAIKAEEKAEEMRKKMFDAEIARIERLNEMQNKNIDFNMALSQGKFDEAAKIRNDSEAQNAASILEAASTAGNAKSDRRIERLNKRKDAISEAKDRADKAMQAREASEKAHLQKMSQMRKDALKRDEDRNMEALKKDWDARKENMQKAIDLFMKGTVTNAAEAKKLMKKLGLDYEWFEKKVITPKGKTWGKYFGTQLHDQLVSAGMQLANSNMWEQLGKGSVRGILKAMGFSSMGEFKNFVTTGEMGGGGPGGKKGGKKNPYGGTGPSGQSGWHDPNARETRHEGGIVGTGGSSRKGVPRTHKGLHSSEVLVRAQKGEAFINKRATAEHPDLINALNTGAVDKGKAFTDGPGVGGFGFAPLVGVTAGVMAAMYMKGIKKAMENANAIGQQKAAANASAAFGAGVFGGTAGHYGSLTLDSDQMKNAATIASVGSKMGMSVRDIEIGIMTAITESMLRNIHGGDRDSQGLFQQRPSQGWGTVAQVTDPTYAAKKFFSVLKTHSDRGKMSPWMAAQSVQRSAYSDGSNYAQYWDEAQAIFGKGLTRKNNAYTAATAGGFVAGPGGKHRPIAGSLTQGLHDTSTGYPAVDIGAPVGTPVYSVADGKVTRSYDLVGNDGRVSNGGYYSYGRVIYVDHGGFSSLYAHLSQRYARTGQQVQGGSKIGLSGNTGHSFGPHLHFGVQGASPYAFLRKGGEVRWDNTPALLHRGETVLTRPLTREFKENVATGGNNTYNVVVKVDGSDVDANELADKVMTAIKKAEARKPQHRKRG